MQKPIFLYNTLSRKKELFTPIHPTHVGMYVCGPTVYGDAHLGHARPAITFDILFRCLQYMGYKVRYVRNITDVGHLESDGDTGEDKIGKKARLEAIEPMEVVQYFTNRYRTHMATLNVLPPSIEPTASGHIPEQIALVQKILDNGLAYESKGSIYFDVLKYNETKQYGKLSGRVIEDLITNTRALDGQEEKRNGVDFAIWKNASPEHIMKWQSPWGVGFPGWHMECTAMGSKYLGETFDIHGGGMDLLFPHHECEIAQSQAAFNHDPANYWVHNNMITINGQKMGKSLNNFITLEELFSGNHTLLEKAYSPMTIRFFILQAHYRSTLDFSNEALQAAEKGLARLFSAVHLLEKLTPGQTTEYDIPGLVEKVYDAICDDLNTPMVIAHLFEAVKFINLVNDGKATITAQDITLLKTQMDAILSTLLGLIAEKKASEQDAAMDKVMHIVMELRQQSKANKDWATADKIRQQLNEVNIQIKDTKEGAVWQYGSN